MFFLHKKKINNELNFFTKKMFNSFKTSFLNTKIKNSSNFIEKKLEINCLQYLNKNPFITSHQKNYFFNQNEIF